MIPIRKMATAIVVATLVIGGGPSCTAQGQDAAVALPAPDLSNGLSLTDALYLRRCVRSIADTPVDLEQLGQLLWAGNGSMVDAVSGPTRTAPSAGGLYPVELYAVAGKVDGLPAGVYWYNSESHSVELVREGDIRGELARAALMQRFIEEAPVTIVVAVVFERTTRRYGERGRERYALIDAGHAAQNVLLQVTALGLGATPVGAFQDAEVKQLLGLEKPEPLYLIPVGVPR